MSKTVTAQKIDVLSRCAERILDTWQGGSRDAYFLMRARHQAESTIEVLRELGMLNEHGIEFAQREIGTLKEMP